VIYLLDTNMVSYIARRKSPLARARLEAVGHEDSISISAITEAEVRYGLARRPEAHALRAAMEAFLFKVRVLSWGSTEAAAYGELRAKLEAAGITLAEMDLLIAAHAVGADAVLVSHDKAFQHVTSFLKVTDWATDIE
jgi:tRNA(fMet)-specific endonuclease VapC